MSENNNRTLPKTTEEARAAEAATKDEKPMGPLHTEIG